MSKTLILLAAIAVFSVVIIQVSGLTCYQCNSAYDPRCGDPMDDYSLGHVNCSMKKRPEHLEPNSYRDAVLCRKIVQKIYNKIRIIRGCGYITDEERDDLACVKRSGTHDVFATYCSCTTDLCNGATKSSITNHLVLLFSTLIAFIYCKINC